MLSSLLVQLLAAKLDQDCVSENKLRFSCYSGVKTQSEQLAVEKHVITITYIRKDSHPSSVPRISSVTSPTHTTSTLKKKN